MFSARPQFILYSLAILTLTNLVAFGFSTAAALTTDRVADGLEMPVYCTAPAGDTERLFIVEQRGAIRILAGDQLLATPFLDLDALIPDVSGNDERGLLGLVFHPDYDQNGYFYLNYTNLQGDTIIARYQVSANPDVADPGSALTLMTIDQPFENHNGGHLAFGPLDGYLYIGMGDGGWFGDPDNRAQDDGVLLGKMLRIDVDGALPYAIPPDNPFAGPGEPLDEIWAKGLRNPYRFSFDRLTGDLYIADVGQNSVEEVDYQTASSAGGENYGWRVMEGTSCYNNATPPGCFDPSFTDPIHEYTHGGNPLRCSVTGGYVYRGTALPEIQGHYFFADYCSDQIWSFRVAGGVATELTERTSELAPGGGLSINNISGFGEDGVGNLYIVDRTGFSSGEVYRIVDSSAGVGEATSPRLPVGLGRALPNPFATGTRFEVTLDTAEEVEISIYTTAGRLIRHLRRGTTPVGTHQFHWDGRDREGRDLPSGVYLLRMAAAGEAFTRRLTLLR